MNSNNHTRIWARIDIIAISLEPSSPRRKLRKKRIIPSGTGPNSKRNKDSKRKLSSDWCWAQAIIVPTSSSPSKNSRRNSHSRLKSGESIRIVIDDRECEFDGKTVNISPTNAKDGIVMANSWINEVDELSNDSSPPDDLIQLTHLHEPAVVHCLRKRYDYDKIYTATGPILLALNPFKRCPELYSEKIVCKYFTQGELISKGLFTDENMKLPPHVYGVADNAFRSMMRVLDSEIRNNGTIDSLIGNQSILVSGESGAGKTMTTKFIMQYLASLSQRASDSELNISSLPCEGIEKQVLKSNPILESFGNARTVRNDNSSRFGKFIEIQFRPSGSLVGASIKTYLLEKVRLITQAPGERNYHIFYEILAAASKRDREKYLIQNNTAKDFKMTCVSGTFERRDGVNDRETYKDLMEAMETMKFTKKEQNDVLVISCALLHASNLSFSETSLEKSELNRSNPSLKSATLLLGLTIDSLDKALCTCEIEAGRGEKLVKNLSKHKAEKCLEALIKATYGALFTFIVQRVNESITQRKGVERIESSSGRTNESHCPSTIGVLDIFGFESFTVNSFEQLCINYCNEALQQQFNRFVFKLEQQEYEREGIEWSFIEFPDNQDVLDLIDKKHSGILSILDEQCRLAKCTDQTFANATYDKCSDHPRFECSAQQRVSGLFSVNHYAGPVEYSTHSFLEKNKDELSKECTNLLISSTNTFLTDLGIILSSPFSHSCQNGNGKSGRKLDSKNLRRSSSSSLSRASVGSQFSSQLVRLRQSIESTTPHYIRCLKPNDDLFPNNFDPVIIADQLRCAGVLEAVRVSRVGYPQRYSHLLFVHRYRLLALGTINKISKRGIEECCKTLIKIVAKQIIDIESSHDSCANGETEVYKKKDSFFSDKILIDIGIQIGKTKVFLRQRAFDILERLRNQKLDMASIHIQSAARRFIARQFFLRFLHGVLLIQCMVRKAVAITYVQRIRQKNGAIKIQRIWRMFTASKLYKATMFIARFLQKLQRGISSRKRFMYMKKERYSIVIQRQWRMYYRKRVFHVLRHFSIKIQCFVRCFNSRQILRELKGQARDLKLIINERNKLRAELHETKKNLDEAMQTIEKWKKCSLKLEGNHHDFLDDVLVLRNENQRLKKELALANAQSCTTAYQNFPDNPTDQEKELRRLYEVFNQKECEIKNLRNQIISLKGDKNSYDNEHHPSSPRKRFISKMFSRVIPNDSSDAYIESDTITSSSGELLTPRSPSKRRMFTSPLGTLQEFLGRSSEASFEKKLNYDSIQNLSPSSFEGRFDGDYWLHSSVSNSSEMLSPLSTDAINAKKKIPTQHANPSFLSSSFVDMSGNKSPFHTAVRAVDNKALCEAIEDSKDVYIDINTGDHEGRTPLHLAALNAAPQLVRLLLEHHAVTNAQDHAGNTPLHYAEEINVIRILLDEGNANPNIPNGNGLCALHLAVRRRDFLAVESLLAHDADVNVADDMRWYTPIHLVAQSEQDVSFQATDSSPCSINHTESLSLVGKIAKLLCDATKASEPDLNSQDRDGNTPLHHAAILSESWANELVWIFLQKGGNPNERNRRGQTPLHLLCHNQPLRQFDSFQETVELMLFHGADPNVSSQSGCTALHLALYHGDTDTAVQLVQHGAGFYKPWIKPSRWEAFWDETGSAEVLPIDMITDEWALHRLLSAITQPQEWAGSRQECMQCKTTFGTFSRQHHCRHCGRLVCGHCSLGNVDSKYFPKSFSVLDLTKGSTRVCSLCEEILTTRQEQMAAVHDSLDRRNGNLLKTLVNKSLEINNESCFDKSEMESITESISFSVSSPLSHVTEQYGTKLQDRAKRTTS